MAKPWHIVRRYMHGIESGKITAGKLERAAVERHRRDLADGHKRGLVFRAAEGQRVLDFFEGILRHSKGEWAGQPFILSDWQAFILWSVFGWYRADGTRRFHYAYNELG